jgi:hypothetical protein
LVGLEALDADLLEAGEEFADAVVVGDPVLVFGGLVFFEVFADGFVFDFAGPVPVGAVWAGWVGLAGAAGASAAGVALGDRAGEDVGGAGDLGEFGGDSAGFVALCGVESHFLLIEANWG